MPAVGYFLEVADRRFASVKFPYQMETWGWSAGLSTDPAAAQAQALANEALAMDRAEKASAMRYDEHEVAAYRSHHWFETMMGWRREAEFWASVAADAAAVSVREAA
jgi:hypothetical protein